MKDRKTLILSGSILSTMIRITIPSIIGMFGMMVFNIVDTYFVGQLGSLELAAISFTFPVIMVISSLVFGIGVAAMALFSRAAGQQNFQEEQMLATSTLTLGISISLVTGIIGFMTIEPLFSFLGADKELLVLIKSFMRIWYMGAGFMVIPMLGDSILRGLGDTFTPAFVMMTAAMLNVALDPLLIFGIGPFPALGIEGAAIATVASRGVAAIVSILIQAFREHLLTIHRFSIRNAWVYWRRLFHIGLPNSAVRAISPLGTAVFTSILARYGHQVVAGYGVAAKIESVFLAIINAFTITATVFIGQNLGAGNNQRVHKGIHFMELILMGLGLGMALIFFFTGDLLAKIFNEETMVRSTTSLYLMIVPVGYGFLSLTQIAASILNVYHKPWLAGGLSLFQIGVIAVPGSFLLSHFFGVPGVFSAICASFVVTGIFSQLVVKKQTALHVI